MILLCRYPGPAFGCLNQGKGYFVDSRPRASYRYLMIHGSIFIIEDGTGAVYMRESLDETIQSIFQHIIYI